VVNYSSEGGNGLTASVELLNLDGSVKLKKLFGVDCPIDAVRYVYKLEKTDGLSSAYFVRLELKKGNEIVSGNFYWNGLVDGNVQAIRNLPKLKLDATTKTVKQNGKWYLTTLLINKTKTPALMVKINVVGTKDRERILPVFFSDNYVSLMPGDKRIIKIELDNSDTRGNVPEVKINGINIL
jgi:hypothetical protein